MYDVSAVPLNRRVEAQEAMDGAWGDAEPWDKNPKIPTHNTSGLETCPRCRQPGVIMADDQGTKIEHPGRMFPCRIGWRASRAEPI